MSDLLQRSMLCHTHLRAGRLCRRGPAHRAWAGSSLLPGRRDFGWPMLSLQAQRELGSVRHALAQRVVAGTMTVTPPLLIQAPPRPEGSGLDEPHPNLGV